MRKHIQRVLLKIASWLEPQGWEGIYSKWSEVPTWGPGFSGPRWTEESEAALKDIRSTHSVQPEHLLLPFLVSGLLQNEKNVRVLDFGGGYGLFYEQINQSVINNHRVDYHVIDTPEVSERAATHWHQSPRIRFHTDWPRFPVDIVFLCSSLQYVEDYRSTLKRLCEDYRPRYVLFVKFSGVDMPTYATAQKNLKGSSIPCWFLNLAEVIDMMTEYGYHLTYKSTLDKTYLQTRFPETYRMGKASNLLFQVNA